MGVLERKGEGDIGCSLFILMNNVSSSSLA